MKMVHQYNAIENGFGTRYNFNSGVVSVKSIGRCKYRDRESIERLKKGGYYV